LLRAIYEYKGQPVTAAALKLAALTFVRPGELRHAKWSDIDLNIGEWRYTATKTKSPHIVPLSSQALDVLRDLFPLTGAGELVFPDIRSSRSPISENTINAALRRLGYDNQTMTGHGFRAMARTMLDEQLNYRTDFVEHQLAHAVRDPNGRAYNRTAHIAERKKMMQAWADYLDALRSKVT
jgi:integrase